jgi:hypothetical protein
VRRKRNVLMLAAACAVPLVALAAGTARADTITPITQLSGFNQMAVDIPANYIFMSGGGSIVVTDLSGKYVTTLDAGDGVAGIVLSSDGDTLYAALTAGGTGVTNTVTAITVSTVTATTPAQTYDPLGTGDVPHSLAVQSGTLWVSYQGTAADSGAIGNIDLTSGTFTAATAPGSWSSAPDLAADPSDTGVLVAVLPGTNPATAATFGTTATAATPVAAQATLGAAGSPCEYEHQIAVVPGGAAFIVACGAPVNENAYSTTDLEVKATYDTGNTYPGGVAIDADGTVAVGTYGPDADIRVYDASGTLLNVFSLGESSQVVAMDGLAWEDTTPVPELAAMEQPSGPFTLAVFDQPKVTRSALTLTTASTAVIGKAITLTGSLTLSNGAALPAKSTVAVTRTGPGGTKTFPAVSPGSTGSFTLADTPPATGKYTYTASYAGDGQITTSATATASVTVKPYSAKLSLGGSSHVYIGKSVTLTGTLAFGSGSVPARTKLTVTRTGRGASKQFTVATGTKGAFRVTDTPTETGTYTYAIKYAGSATTASATVSRAVSVTLNPTVLTIATNGGVFTYEPTVRITAHLGPTYKNRSVKVYARWLGSKASTLIKTGRVNSSGDLTVSYRAPHSTTFSVVFSGDARYAAKTVTRTISVRADVSESISGYYGSKNVGGTLYRLYHDTGLLDAAASVAPDKHGECVRFEVQEYYEGAWNPNVTTGCVSLSASSRAAADFGLTHADLGFPYRIRADYVRSASDVSNESGDSGWLYLMVES